MASVNGSDDEGGTFKYAASSLFARKKRTAKSDLESLVYSLWSLAGLPEEKCGEDEVLFDMFDFIPEGYTFAQNLMKGKRYAREQFMVSN